MPRLRFLRQVGAVARVLNMSVILYSPHKLCFYFFTRGDRGTRRDNDKAVG